MPLKLLLEGQESRLKLQPKEWPQKMHFVDRDWLPNLQLLDYKLKLLLEDQELQLNLKLIDLQLKVL